MKEKPDEKYFPLEEWRSRDLVDEVKRLRSLIAKYRGVVTQCEGVDFADMGWGGHTLTPEEVEEVRGYKT